MISTRLKVVGVAIAAVVALTMFLAVSQASSRSAGIVSVDPVQVRAPIDDATGQAPADPGASAAAAYVKPAVPADQLSDAKTALTGNALVKRLLAAHGIQILNSAPWTDGSGSTTLGVDLTIKLASPVSGSAALPSVAFHADEHAYDRVVEHVDFSGASEFDVLFDNASKQIVRIAPLDASSVTAQAGQSQPTTSAANGHSGE
jgi:hypothetical protein